MDFADVYCLTSRVRVSQTVIRSLILGMMNDALTPVFAASRAGGETPRPREWAVDYSNVY